MLVLGLSGGFGHDASACLLSDGRLIAMAEEERFTRVKRAIGASPTRSAQYCLQEAGVTARDIDCVALSWLPKDGHSRNQADSIVQSMRIHNVLSNSVSVQHLDHHLSHAAAAYFCSGFEEAAVLVLDGHGDGGVSTTLAHAKGDKFEVLRQFPLADSLGHFYSAAMRHLKLGEAAEGKLMGLAAYGKPSRRLPIELNAEGYRLLPTAELPMGSLNESYLALRRQWSSYFTTEFGEIDPPIHPSDRIEDITANSSAVQDYINLAASVQQTLEEIVAHLAQLVIDHTGCGRLVLGGGVALNCSANSVLALSPRVEDLYVFPAANDGGASLGAACLLATQCGDVAAARINTAYWGPQFSQESCVAACAQTGLSVTAYSDDEAVEAAAELLAEGQIIGWFQGRMEVGPRALGNRSILANPASLSTRDRVNRIKGRELWRPLAPSVLAQHADEYLEGSRKSPFMLLALSVVQDRRSRVPAIVHTDGTTRPQTVTDQGNPRFHLLISRFMELTSIPLVLNTSFNAANEPIVCTPTDALRTFISSDLDALFLGNIKVTKSG